MSYTPINKWKLSKRGRELFDLSEKISRSSVENIYLIKDDFDHMLEGITPSRRHCYSDAIPFMGKKIVRKL